MIQDTGIIVISLLVLAAVLLGIQRFLKSNPNSLLHQSKGWLYALVTFFGLAIIFALLPIEKSAKNSVFSVLGLVVTAVIAISSTTFASNMMAGIMLRIISNFKLGDFIEVGSYFGRVSEIGLLHTEIQTKSHTLTTLPNLYLVTNAVTVVPSQKALIDATLSLGYDVSHHQVEEILQSAAEKIGLFDAFVQVVELGDFSITYRVAGFLDNPKLLLSMRSNLRKQVIDSLHGAGVEIVSPTFMNQRQYRSDEMFISEVKKYQERHNSKAEPTHVFDKAETAETLADLKMQLKTLEEQLKTATDTEKAKLLQQQQRLNKQIAALAAVVEDDPKTNKH
ncbi:MAG: mechanosensitive ion channel protein MscS [Gammaproteobacteria bacterium]|nr:MAG: mechanosensitive ion channel protein MscS [Gammaproteobacteria bacterium]